MTARKTAVLVLAALLGAGPAAQAHTTSTGLATLTVTGAEVTYRLTLVLGELPEEPARLIAAAADGEPGSVERIAAALRDRVSVRADRNTCRPGRAVIQGSRLGDSRATLTLALRCPAAPIRLIVREDWFDLLGAHYRTIARIEGSGVAREVIFLPDSREVTVDLGTGAPDPHGARGGFFRLGVEHILAGYDHLLFLLALLVRGGRLWSLVKIVTAFTLAHSVTLALAVLGLVTVPARVVEPAIAASIVWVAWENIASRDAPSRRWLVSFLFGLVHGLGFASALGPLDLPPWSLGMALLGFNLGVEAGQSIVIAAAAPVLAWIRAKPWERRLVRMVSLVLAAVGTAWFVERLFFA
jgi:hydrogenase/urease accessory protein HupE